MLIYRISSRQSLELVSKRLSLAIIQPSLNIPILLLIQNHLILQIDTYTVYEKGLKSGYSVLCIVLSLSIIQAFSPVCLFSGSRDSRPMSFDQQMDASLAALTQFLHEFKPVTDSVEVHESDLLSTSNKDQLSHEVGQRCPVRSGNSGATSRPARPRPGMDSPGCRREIRSALAAKRQSRYLTKVKEERRMLRTEVVELSAVLDRLQKAQARANALAASDLALSAWRTTAIRQKERRLESEAKQRQLKALVANQSRLIHSMNEILQERMLCSSITSTELLPSGMTILFKTLMQELNPLHAMTNEVSAGVEFKLSSLPMQFAMYRDWNHDMTFLESAHATVVPFGFDETCHALSDALLTNFRRDGYTNGIVDPENTRAFKYNVNFSQELGDSATLDIHLMVRRYMEADRVVFVSRALTEGQGEFKGLYTDETAWYVLRKSANASEGNALVLETYTRLIPVGFDLTSETDERGHEFVKVLVKADDEDVDDIMEMFKQMLLDETQAMCL
ncbi:hypothetical protein F443_19829 [Phytophthora nicotianae P1569]|uniref:Uncharacterized protein n=1 Tax=Phytophthora nicotianae P1569 TaxID=1317065 RepID=V9E377_PHYNI|nr:hypothetical protein F443_19829 [Phytophthora nicotianae P1569]